MKEGISLTTLFKSLVAFTILFAAFISLTIVYNRAYKLKNETLSILEKYEGVNNTSLRIINNYLYNSAYRTKGTCDLDEFGAEDIMTNNPVLEKVTDTRKKYYYCVEQYFTLGNSSVGDDNKMYFHFKLFYNFNLPILGDIFTFKINGETKKIKYYSEDQKLN